MFVQQCIYYGDSKYGNEIKQYWHFFNTIGLILKCLLQTPAAWEILTMPLYKSVILNSAIKVRLLTNTLSLRSLKHSSLTRPKPISSRLIHALHDKMYSIML